MSRPVCEHCVPRVSPFPSGPSWAHERGCPNDTGQKIAHADELATVTPIVRPDTPRRDTARRRRHVLETASKGVATRRYSPNRLRADELHPVCVLALTDGGEPCARCKWLVSEEL